MRSILGSQLVMDKVFINTVTDIEKKTINDRLLVKNSSDQDKYAICTPRLVVLKGHRVASSVGDDMRINLNRRYRQLQHRRD